MKVTADTVQCKVRDEAFLNVKILSLFPCLRTKILSTLRARLSYVAPGCSRFLGRSEHTCGTRAQQEDSVGFEPTTS